MDRGRGTTRFGCRTNTIWRQTGGGIIRTLLSERSDGRRGGMGMGMGVSVREGQRMYECVGEQNVRRRRRRPLGLQTIDRVGVVVCVWYELHTFRYRIYSAACCSCCCCCRRRRRRILHPPTINRMRFNSTHEMEINNGEYKSNRCSTFPISLSLSLFHFFSPLSLSPFLLGGLDLMRYCVRV